MFREGCNLTRERAEWCKVMGTALDIQPNARRRGLAALQLASLDNGGLRTAGVVWKASSTDRGVVLNVCPWCGASLLGALETPTNAHDT